MAGVPEQDTAPLTGDKVPLKNGVIKVRLSRLTPLLPFPASLLEK
jgi:hypothetical protein